MPDATLPTLYIPHGGGPCFFMEWDPPDTWTSMGDWLRQLGASIGVRPKAVIVVSAHWEESEFSVSANPAPGLIYDYYGFPEHTYRIQYPAPGAPELAQRVADLLGKAGIPARLDRERGYDHGVFIPFKLIYPDADIPTIQLSLKAGLDPAAHIAAGAALAPLREEGVLIVGSGMSYHNLRGFGPAYGPVSQQFDAWLGKAVEAAPATRDAELIRWRTAPMARQAHPREEHLIPLMVAAGAAGKDAGHIIYSAPTLGLAISGYQFGGSPGTAH